MGGKEGAFACCPKPPSFRRLTGMMRSRTDTAALTFLRLVPVRRCNARSSAYRLDKSCARVTKNDAFSADSDALLATGGMPPRCTLWGPRAGVSISPRMRDVLRTRKNKKDVSPAYVTELAVSFFTKRAIPCLFLTLSGGRGLKSWGITYFYSMSVVVIPPLPFLWGGGPGCDGATLSYYVIVNGFAVGKQESALPGAFLKGLQRQPCGACVWSGTSDKYKR
jgi:hypothetical protein